MNDLNVRLNTEKGRQRKGWSERKRAEKNRLLERKTFLFSPSIHFIFYFTLHINQCCWAYWLPLIGDTTNAENSKASEAYTRFESILMNDPWHQEQEKEKNIRIFKYLSNQTFFGSKTSWKKNHHVYSLLYFQEFFFTFAFFRWILLWCKRQVLRFIHFSLLLLFWDVFSFFYFWIVRLLFLFLFTCVILWIGVAIPCSMAMMYFNLIINHKLFGTFTSEWETS